MEELRKILNDIRQGKDIEKYLLVILALAIGIIDIVGFGNQAIINAVILAVLAILAYGRISDRRKQDIKISGISEFHENRSTVPTLEATFLPAKNEIILIGVALSGVISYQRTLLEEKARKGCKIKIALWNPPFGNFRESVLFNTIESLANTQEVPLGHHVHIERFQDWFTNIDESIRKNIEIRGYSTMPTASVFLIDKDLPNGLIHFEPIIYKARPEKQPSFRLSPHDSPELFRELSSRYSQLWTSAKVLFGETAT